MDAILGMVLPTAAKSNRSDSHLETKEKIRKIRTLRRTATEESKNSQEKKTTIQSKTSHLCWTKEKPKYTSCSMNSAVKRLKMTKSRTSSAELSDSLFFTPSKVRIPSNNALATIKVVMHVCIVLELTNQPHASLSFPIPST